MILRVGAVSTSAPSNQDQTMQVLGQIFIFVQYEILRLKSPWVLRLHWLVIVHKPDPTFVLMEEYATDSLLCLKIGNLNV
jgi:hypothetical protein